MWARAWFKKSVPWREVCYWALDLEMSGIDPESCDILSVGMVPIRDGTIRWSEHYYREVRPTTPFVGKPETVAIHGLINSDLQSARELSSVLPEVFDRLSGAVLLVHHAAIDVGFTRSAATALGLKFPEIQIVDTVRLIERYNRRGQWLGRQHQDVSRSLSGARAHFDLPTHCAHDALSDALATAELMLCLRAKLAIKTLRELT